MPAPIKTRGALSESTRAILTKLPSEAVSVLEDLIEKVADNNNANNFSEPAPVSRAEMLKKVDALPDSDLKAVLKAHGII